MYADALDEKRTAFRREEKRYQLHRDQTFLTRRKKKVGGPLVTRKTDMGDALDSRNLRALAESGGGEHGVRRVALIPSGDRNETAPREAYELATRPGCVIFPGALDVATQRKWLVDAVTRLCEPPAATNHDAEHGKIAGLWEAATSGDPRWLEPVDAEVETERDDVFDEADARGSRMANGKKKENAPKLCRWTSSRPANASDRTSAVSLLRRLRWTTLGPPYDWTNRTYKRDEPFNDVPEDIKARCDALVASFGDPEPEPEGSRFLSRREGGSFSNERVFDESFDEGRRETRSNGAGACFRFGAGLVNYYRSGDALAGHVDDAENDLKKPIVSFSLGSPCVFLLGGDDRDEKPSALLLRSGDAVVLARESRRRFHGVPRIFTKQENAVDGRGELLAAPDEVSDPKCWPEKPEVARYVAGGRVNISVRDID
jgi:alkylated DNA repair protein alkB family protein 1